MKNVKDSSVVVVSTVVVSYGMNLQRDVPKLLQKHQSISEVVGRKQKEELMLSSPACGPHTHFMTIHAIF